MHLMPPRLLVLPAGWHLFPHQVPPETIAAMGRVASAVVRATPLPVGINVLRNDGAGAWLWPWPVSAYPGECAEGAMVNDRGLIQGCAARLLRQRRPSGGR